MIYAIGDIHGQIQKLVDLLAFLDQDGMRDDDTLVFVGDYIDRGPDTASVLDRLILLRNERPNTVFLRGNHEQMLLDARQRFDPSFDNDSSVGNNASGSFWFAEGGTQTLQSYGLCGDKRWYELIPQAHWQFILATRLEYDEGPYKFVHAGVLPEGETWSIGDFDADPRLWIRTLFHVSDSDFNGQVVVFGHTPTADGRPVVTWNKIGIDTGAGYGGPLTAIVLPTPFDRRLVRVIQSK